MKTTMTFLGLSIGAMASLIGIFIMFFGIPNTPSRQNNTKYQAYYDGLHINCNMMSMTKNCANLSDCDDRNSYFCVQNVKMFVDKK